MATYFIIRSSAVWGRIMMRVLALAITLSALAVAQTAPSPASIPVSAAGKVSSHFTVEKGLVPFAFTIRNDSTSELRDLQIVNPPNGYLLEQLYLDPLPVCDGVKSATVDLPLISQCLPAGQSVVAWGNFRATSTHKSESLLVVLHWKTVSQTKAPGTNKPNGSEEKESSLVVDLGENEVRSQWWVDVSDYLPFVVPVIAALAIAVLTFLFNWRLASNSRRTEVLKQMLIQMQNYGSKFYMPMSSAAQGLQEELSKNLDNPATPQSFFFFLLLQRTMLDLLGEIGGAFFSDNRGEVLAGACWDQIFNWFYQKGRIDPLYLNAYAAAKVITARSDYEEFSSRFVAQPDPLILANPAIDRCWTEFAKSMNQRQNSTNQSEKVAELIILLSAFSKVVDCEINRVNKYWYPSVVSTRANADVWKKLHQLASDGKISRWKTFRYFWPWELE
jgi:hypothetical protein